MVKFREVKQGSVVQLGRFNGPRKDMSGAVGMVEDKQTIRIENSTWTAIAVRIAPNRVELVSLHNIKDLLN